HINSDDPFAHPAIDPQFLSREFDAAVLLATVKFMQRVGNLSPFADMIANQSDPSPTAQTSDDLLSTVGTAAMAPRNAGGVVNSSLLVYGTRNVRVVDASIIPLHIGCHIQSTTYAIAEKVSSPLCRCSYGN
ncbi:hypothetical protein POSPLADRAFT_1141676, partial [Postia placenta MAD-698-R-SB12]